MNEIHSLGKRKVVTKKCSLIFNFQAIQSAFRKLKEKVNCFRKKHSNNDNKKLIINNICRDSLNLLSVNYSSFKISWKMVLSDSLG